MKRIEETKARAEKVMARAETCLKSTAIDETKARAEKVMARVKTCTEVDNDERDDDEKRLFPTLAILSLDNATTFFNVFSITLLCPPQQQARLSCLHKHEHI